MKDMAVVPSMDGSSRKIRGLGAWLIALGFALVAFATTTIGYAFNDGSYATFSTSGNGVWTVSFCGTSLGAFDNAHASSLLDSLTTAGGGVAGTIAASVEEP